MAFEGESTRPSVWVVTVYENDAVIQFASLSLDGIAGFLWKRKFRWYDDFALDEGHEISIPTDLFGLFDGIQLETLEAVTDEWNGEAHLGPFGPVVNGKDTGFELFVHLTRLTIHP